MGVLFNPQKLKSLKPAGQRQEIRDLGGENLYVVVQPKTGEVSFVIRAMVDGKQRKKTVGSFPAVTLAEARDKARELKVALKRGEPLPFAIGPAKPVSEASSGITVIDAWSLYWEHEASSRKSAKEKQRIFDREVAPVIGHKLIGDVTSDDLDEIVQAKFEEAKTSSNRLHSLLARFFKWSVTHGRTFTKLSSNPMMLVAKRFSERNTARQRYFNRQELTWWFQSLEAAGAYKPIHELLMRTLCRFSDILDLTWGEVTKLENGDDVLALGDTKNGQPHLVYLNPSAFSLLPERPEDAKPNDRVFKVVSRSGKPVERMRARMEALAKAEGLTVPHWQPHDYRRTGTTHLAGLFDENDAPLVPDHILDKLLGHKELRVIRHYNRYAYYREKKQALAAWSESLDAISPNTAI